MSARFRRQKRPTPLYPFEVLVQVPGQPQPSWCAVAGWVDAFKNIHSGDQWSPPRPLAPLTEVTS